MKYLLLALLLLGCENEPISEVNTQNPNISVAFLFEHDGCKVYRFYDNGARYFVNCGNGRARTEGQHSEGAGKTRRTVHDTVETFQEEQH